MLTSCGAGTFLRSVVAYVARELQLWYHACQLSYKDPGVVFSSEGEKKELGSIYAECCASFFTPSSLNCVLKCLGDLLGVHGQSCESPSQRLKSQFVELFPCLPCKIDGPHFSWINRVHWVLSRLDRRVDVLR